MAQLREEPAAGLANGGRAHKRVRWHVPVGEKRRPGVLDATTAELVRGLEQRRGSVWLRVAKAVSVAGYSADRAFSRVRSLRADGAESLLALAVALLYCADVRSGFVGKPRPGGGHWKRYSLRDLAQLAYAGQSEAELRRARRSLDMMVSLGWVFPTKQVRRHVDGEFRSEAAVRRLNLTRICQMTGTAWLLSRDREHADRTKGSGTASLQAARQRHQRTIDQPLASRAGEGLGTPPATGDPAAVRKGMQHVADILALLK